jgi:CubicO group peptidase (beta-lactamase class C family)
VRCAFAQAAAEQSPCGVPKALDDGWQIETQTNARISTQRLCDLVIRLESKNIHGVILVRQGHLVFEHYQAGEDERWGTPLGIVAHGPDVKHDIRSASKSVVSLLIGIALERKLIANIDEPVFKFFPERAALATPEKQRILIRHLLTMSSGLAWDEKRPYSDPENSERRMIVALDPYRFVLEQPLTTVPGEVWNYSGGSTALLGAIIQRTSKQWIADFAREVLFKPLGIHDFEWLKMPYGEYAAASGLRLRPRDMAKLGQLVLSNGAWNGRRIVPTEWLKQSLQGRFSPEPNIQYGFQWWIGSSQVGVQKIEWVEAYGLGSQRIIIVPALNLVVVFTTGLYHSDDPGTTDLLDNFILPAALQQ